jgi:hypothetical protein
MAAAEKLRRTYRSHRCGVLDLPARYAHASAPARRIARKGAVVVTALSILALH